MRDQVAPTSAAGRAAFGLAARCTDPSSGLRSPSCSSVPNLSIPSTVVVASTAPSSRHIRPSNWHWSRPAGTAARSTSVGSMEGGPFLPDLTVVVGFGCSGPQSRARAPPVTAAHDCLGQHTGAGSDGTLPPPPTASQGTPVAPHASMAMVERPRVAGQARQPSTRQPRPRKSSAGLDS